MNLLFQRRYKYRLGESIKEVRAELEDLLKYKKFDFSIGLYGDLKNDDTFKLISKFVIGINAAGHSVLAVAYGKLQPDGERTVIRVTFRASNFALVQLYAILLAFIIITLSTISGSSGSEAYAGSVVVLFIFSFFWVAISLSVKKLKRQFERALGIRSTSEKNK